MLYCSVMIFTGKFPMSYCAVKIVTARKFYIRRNNKKVDSIEIGRIVIAHLLP